MKGISTTLVIIVTAIVILVAAIVILTIFSEALWPIVDITEARSTCITQAGGTCVASGTLPLTWDAQFYYREGATKKLGSCKTFYPNCKCVDNELVDCTLA